MGATFLAYCLSVAQKCHCVISLCVKQSQLCQFDVMSSMEGTKAGSVCVYVLRECVVNELEKEAGMEEASNFHWSITSP